MARAAFALVITTALKGSRGSATSTASMRISGASVTSWPRARRRAAVRSPSCCGRVTSKRMPSHDRWQLLASGKDRVRSSPRKRGPSFFFWIPAFAGMNGVSALLSQASTPSPSHRREEIGAGALLELAAGLGAETNGIGGGALTLRLVNVAAVGLGDQAAKAQPPGGDGGMARDRRAAGALEHREEGALGRQRCGGVGVVDGGEQRERALVVAARLDGDDPLPDRRQEVVDGKHRGRGVGKPEPLQAGKREHDGVDLAGRK